jgi:hypothetical protein
VVKDTIEERLGHLEDIQAIKRLKVLYGWYWDAGFRSEEMNPKERAAALADLFVEDGLWADVVGDYHCAGRDAIRAFAEEVLTGHEQDGDGNPRALPGSAVHIFGTDSIEVDEDTATGRWTALLAGSVASQELAWWSGLHYEDRFVRTPTGWRFQSVRFDRAFATSFDGPGWVRERWWTGDRAKRGAIDTRANSR